MSVAGLSPPVASRVAGILPFRGLGGPKTRLSGVLSIEDRRALALALLERAIRSMCAGGVETLAIVTMDPRLSSVGIDPCAEIIVQSGAGLNDAIHLGQLWAIEHGADATLTVLPDLPLLSADDISALVWRSNPHTAVIAPDRHGQGTNALLLHPPDAVASAFGDGSADRHRRGLALAEIAVVDLQRPGIHLDLDTPDDLEHLLALGYDWRDLVGTMSVR